MTIIFAKHDGCNKEFIFEVPAGMYPVRNDLNKDKAINRFGYDCDNYHGYWDETTYKIEEVEVEE